MLLTLLNKKVINLREINEPFLPDSSFKIFIEIIGMSLILFEMIEVPLILSFPEIKPSQFLLRFITFITFFFFFDILVSFHTSFYYKGELIYDKKKIIKNYLTGWFWIDFFSSFPYDWTIANDYNNNSKFFKIIRFLRFFRVFIFNFII